MTSRVLIVSLALVAFACGADRRPAPAAEPSQEGRLETAASPSSLLPHNPADRSIRHDLALAIDRDSDLKTRDINFIVSNGDVSVSGTVRSEGERRRMNELAMNIPGVRSVANALRVSE